VRLGIRGPGRWERVWDEMGLFVLLICCLMVAGNVCTIDTILAGKAGDEFKSAMESDVIRS